MRTDDDTRPTDLVMGRDGTPTYASTARAASEYDRADFDGGMYYVGTTYCANGATVDYARKLERERQERDAARRAEYEAQHARKVA